MRTLEFKVEKQIIRKQPGCDFSNLVAKSAGYLQAKFHFIGDEWTDCKKAASFWLDNHEYPVLLDSDDTCTIPSEVLGSQVFYVSVTGATRDGLRIPTTKYKVRQEVY